MTVRFAIAVVLLGLTAVTASPKQAAAQLRLQETPELAGWGHLFRDVRLQFDAGSGNTSASTPQTHNQFPGAKSSWFWGVYVDKPILSTFLDIGYDLVWWEREVLPRDTLEREFFDAVRLVAHYRQGEFFVSGDPRHDEFYIGGRVVFDLGRFARFISVFQR